MGTMKRPLWVVGGTSGIGAAVVEIMAEDGMNRNVMVTGAHDCDVREEMDLERQWREFLEYTAAMEGKQYAEIVYCAGVNRLDMIGNIDMTDLSDVFDVNVMGFIRLINIMRSSGIQNVRMVVVGSDAAERPMRGSINYCASKAALHMAVRVAARELADYGWRVNCVAPGMTAPTGMSDYIDERVWRLRGWTQEKALEYERSQGVIKRRATPYEIANMIVQTLDAPEYLNGSIITINGGR